MGKAGKMVVEVAKHQKPINFPARKECWFDVGRISVQCWMLWGVSLMISDTSKSPHATPLQRCCLSPPAARHRHPPRRLPDEGTAMGTPWQFTIGYGLQWSMNGQ